MTRWFLAWWARRKQPSTSRKEIERQTKRHEALRAIATRETENFLETIIFPEREERR